MDKREIDLGQEYRPDLWKGGLFTILLLIGYPIATILTGSTQDFLLLFSIFYFGVFYPLFFIFIVSMFRKEWKLEPGNKEQRTTDAKEARFLKRASYGRTWLPGLLLSLSIMFTSNILYFMQLLDFNFKWTISLILIIFGFWVVMLLLIRTIMRKIFHTNMGAYWVYIENGVVRQREMPGRTPRYRQIEPFSIHDVAEIKWPDSNDTNKMIILVKLNTGIYTGMHMDQIKDEEEFKKHFISKIQK